MSGRSPRELRIRRHLRVRKRVGGSAERPRLSIFRSNIHIYAQVIDDAAGRTLAAASSKDATASFCGRSSWRFLTTKNFTIF